MTEAKHTPADWDVNEFDDLEGDHHITVVFKSNGCPIAHLYENGYQTRPNARLIAAAPELLESLKAYQAAQAMSRFGDPSDFVWPVQTMRYPGEHSGGYLCPTHGLGYTSRCICCESDYEKHAARSDAKARGARDDALRAAEKAGLAAVAKATGEQA